MELISGLCADIVPHRAFAVHKWFYANPLWYYHRLGTTEEIRAGRTFYRLVDPDLRELCKLLLDAGLHTTPSCQGHFYPRERFERTWDELQREAESIMGPGLEVRDSETGRAYLFRDPDYALPWPDFSWFYQQASGHQNHGYLGVMIPADSPLIDRLRDDSYRTDRARIVFDPELSEALGTPLFNIHVDPATPEERSREWMAITRYMKAGLREELCETAGA